MRLSVTCLVVALAVLAPVSSGAAKDRYTMAQTKANKGEKCLAKGENDRAEILFREAIEIEGSLPMPHLGLGAALVAQQRFEEALEVLAEAEQRYVDWENAEARLELERRQRAFREQQEYRDLAAARAPSTRTPSGLQQMRETHLESEKHLALDRWDLEQFSAISPQVFYLKGISLLRTNRPQDGIEALELCLVLDDRHGLAHYNLAVALLGFGRAAEAKTHLDAALATGVEPNRQFVSDLEAALE